jgi:hypothetical protein
LKRFILLPLGDILVPASVLPFALTHVQNTGAAFGIFAQSNKLFIGLTVVILALLVKMHKELTAQGAWARVGIAWCGAEPWETWWTESATAPSPIFWTSIGTPGIGPPSTWRIRPSRSASGLL